MPRRLTDWIATLAMLALVPILLFAMASVALAARQTSSVWIVELAPDARASLQINRPFTVGYSSRERDPWAVAECRPNATTVYSGTYGDGTIWSSVRPLAPGQTSEPTFTLGESVNPIWTGGGADCTVTLVSFSRDLSRRTVLATTIFAAAP